MMQIRLVNNSSHSHFRVSIYSIGYAALCEIVVKEREPAVFSTPMMRDRPLLQALKADGSFAPSTGYLWTPSFFVNPHLAEFASLQALHSERCGNALTLMV